MGNISFLIYIKKKIFLQEHIDYYFSYAVTKKKYLLLIFIIIGIIPDFIAEMNNNKYIL